MFKKKVSIPQDVEQPETEVQDDANVTAMEDVDMISELGNIPELQDAPDGSRHTVELVVEKRQDGFNLASLQYQGEEKTVDRNEYFKKSPEEQASIDEAQVMGRKPMGVNRAA
jgi:hypothetical protein